jgi:hypothetical protein
MTDEGSNTEDGGGGRLWGLYSIEDGEYPLAAIWL